jgi:nucleoside-diphosphate-sugar epimerase
VRVLVTGGTGFVGSHTTAALRARGHDVRLLVRDAARIERALAPFGNPHVDHVQGDVADRASVGHALDGCDAVVHGASVFSFDPREANRIHKTNIRGAETVLGEAARRGLDPIVHFSSFVALLPCAEPLLHPDVQPAGGRLAYSRTKAEQERVARRLQEQGAPVVIVQPGSAWGPHDPNFGESEQLLRNLLTWRAPFVPQGGFSLVDVRDVANAVARAIEPGRGPRRYLLGGQYVTLIELVHELASLTERRLPKVACSDWLVTALVRLGDLVQHLLPWRLPLPSGGIWLTNLRVRTDDSRAAAELGFRPRPVPETLADMVRSMVAAGRLAPRQAGALASPQAVTA